MTAIRITNDGVGIHVEVDGAPDAPPVVFLHGVTGSARAWDWMGPELTNGRRIIRIDFRGHGRSDHAPGTYDVPHYAADVVAVLSEVCGTQPRLVEKTNHTFAFSPTLTATSTSRAAVLVGHSLGGTVAWWLAQNHPELVSAAFLEDPPLLQGDMGAPENAATRERFERMREAVLADRRAGRSETEIAQRLAATPVGPPGTPPLGEVVFEDAVAATAFGHCRLDVGVIDGAIDGSTLAPLDARSPVTPSILILAADDGQGAAFTTSRAERLARDHSAVEIERVSGAGHGIHSERAHRAEFAERLRRFLDTHAPVTGDPGY